MLAGVDEVGRGAVAGCVLAAAVVLPPDCRGLEEVRDSKQLTRKERERLALEVRRVAVCLSIGAASVREIERLNILRATALAMRRALARLRCWDHALVDGLPVPELGEQHSAIVDGDAQCLSIASASVVAKVCRDHLMALLAARYPEYGWEHNAGYCTPEHLDTLRRLGPTPFHRHTWAPVAQLPLFALDAGA